jgi:hypothetical protein
MKHIKLFESFSSPYYMEISLDEWYDPNLENPSVRMRDSSGKLPPTTKVETKKIMIKDVDVRKLSNLLGKRCSIEVNGYELEINKNLNEISIYLMDDEWYYVNLVTSYVSGRVDKKYYKCDQLYGLIELLKDKNIIS